MEAQEQSGEKVNEYEQSAWRTRETVESFTYKENARGVATTGNQVTYSVSFEMS